MKAVLLTSHGGPEMLRYGEAPDPTAGPGELVVCTENLIHVVQLTNSDRWFFIQLYRWFPSILLRSSDPRRSCVGIGPDFAATGVGNLTHGEGDAD